MEMKLRPSIRLLTGVLLAILNLAEIIFIAKIKRRKRIYEIIIASLSVSDCLSSLSIAIISLISLSKLWKSAENLLLTTYIAPFFFILASIFHLILIAVDRVMVVSIPLQYKTIFTKKRQKIGILLLWIFSLAITISTYIYYDVSTSGSKIVSIRSDPKIQHNASLSIPSNRNESLNLKIFLRESFQNDMQLVLSIVIVASDLFMIFCYSIIIYQMSYKPKIRKTSKSKRNERLPLLCVFVAGVFVIFTLPFAVTRLYLRYVPFWAKYCLSLNSGINSVVYFFHYRFENYQSKD